jgi:lipopolysaccharide transport system permease protein
MYVSPVGFSSNVVPEKWRLLFSLNPLVGIIDGFRWSLMRGQMELRWQVLAMSVVVTLVLFASGIWYFRKTERTFADII